MRYISTRGQAPPVSFLDAVLNGMAPDGGLYVPESWPTFARHAQDAGSGPYTRIASEILELFAGGDLNLEDRREIVHQAYGSGSQFDTAAIAPLRQLDGNCWLLDLTRGPSLAFKDIAMQLIGPLYDHALKLRNRRLSVVCATSGDTGGAAVEALKGRDRVDLFVLFPKGRVSEVQRRFMTTADGEGVHAIEVDGDFDACQAIVKEMFADQAFARDASLSAVNSVNWARIVAQSVYFMRAAAALNTMHVVDFVVPTGNFGDAYSAYVARKLGAPIRRIGIATNSNDILPRALASGRYQRAGASVATISPAMDIQVASNFERILFEVLGRDGVATARLYQSLAQAGGFDIPPAALQELRLIFAAKAASEANTKREILRKHSTYAELICPHTAVGFGAFDGTGAPQVYLATAHAAKFPEVVEKETGVRPALPAHCADLFARHEKFDALPADAEAVKQYIRERSRAWS